ncbi:hypothetical protein KKJ25_05930 [Xenorhabdus bovienii]|uniref:hypothetical protein n=1 Tax=Xenorhabdus bovienii TaxID=40576 RepID=UPI00237D26A2|nr:hypothetical protein [Xenorhabdus bovienii]MDE1494515.1 hypothetical protein [Xenorhabdus bovienii]MDE9472657.1 hypothetical protein [Xenorhabdus bovienii]MDE9533716.1 hypothetical protein [Xenorhabdus bovienii]
MTNETSLNKLIIDRRSIVDDGCDHTASIIDSFNQAARARSRQPYQPKPKLIKVSSRAKASDPVVKIGERINYGRKVVRGIYELSHLGRNAENIAILLKMPLDRVQHVMSCNSSMKRAVYKQVMAAPKPTEKEIMARLAAESKA